MVAAHAVVDYALAQTGDRYVYGAEVTGADSNVWDCSELVEAACRNTGVSPTMPDGAYWQWKHCQQHGTAIPVEQAIHTPGALLFVNNPAIVGYQSVPHVAFSLGNGYTIEARGTAWGVGSWAAAGRFQVAALIPGVEYPTPTAPAAPPVPPPAPRVDPIRPLEAGVGYGKHHPQHRDIQAVLITASFGPIPGSITDYYGDNTGAAVARFHNRYPQFKSKGVVYDRNLGPSGWAYLQSLIGRR